MNMPITSKRDIVTIQQLYDMLVTNPKLHPNPIGQRPPTIDTYQNSKNVGIIQSVLNGFGIDTLIIRDISCYNEMHVLRLMYGSFTHLIIDGGHRCRAIKAFIANKFTIPLNGKNVLYRDLDTKTKNFFLKSDVSIKYVQCSSEQARELFLAINKMTKTNEIENIMSNEESSVCRWIRTNTWYVHEYKNRANIHPIFTVAVSDSAEHESYYWNKPNTGGSFYYHAFITLCKAIGRKNVNAGQKEWQNLVNTDYQITQKDQEVWKKFFTDLQEYQDIINHSSGINDEIFGFFSCVWFELLARHGIDGFKFDMNVFAYELSKLRALMTGRVDKKKKNKYDTMIIQNIDDEDTDIKSLVREYVKAFAYGKKQSFVGKLILSELDDECGILIKDNRRNPSKKDRELMLHEQKNKCYVDQKPLALEEAHAAHIVPRADGGSSDLSNFRMVRNIHNLKMGTLNLEIYKKYYEEANG